MTFETLRSLADRAALFTALRQEQLVAVVDDLGPHGWDVDLDTGRFTFAAEDDATRTIDATPHLIASIAPSARSLMWGWALEQGDRTGTSERLRDYGEQHGIAEFIQGEVAFGDDAPQGGDDLDTWITRLAHAVAGAASEITGLSPYYLAQAGASRAVLLLDAPIPPLTVNAAMTALPRVLSGLTMDDQRGSVWDLARLAGWTLEWADEAFSSATVTDATGGAAFRFDEHARITGIEARLASPSA